MTDLSENVGFDPIPAAGVGAERFDPPSLFYLTHQATIDEWYALHSAVAETVNDWLATTLRDSLAAVAARQRLLLSSARGPSGHEHLVMHHPDTPVMNGKPVIGLGVGWKRASVNPVSAPLFACVRSSANETGRAAASLLLEAGGRAFRRAEQLKGSDADAWPIWWYIRAQDQWWTDLDGYRATVVEQVERGLDGLSGAVVAAATVAVTGASAEDESSLSEDAEGDL